MKKSLLISLTIPLFIAGCDTKDEVRVPACDSNANGTLREMICDFISETRAGADMEDLEIIGVEVKVYNSLGEEIDTIFETRSETMDQTFTLSTVRFSKSGVNGFCILSDDKRLDEIYYLSEYGEPSDTSYIVPLKEYIETVPLIAANDLEKTSTTDVSEAIYIGPLVEYKWGQGYPFNIVAPLCSGVSCSSPEFNGHMPVGCAPLALATFIATTKHNGRYPGVDLFNLPLTNDAFVPSQQDNIFKFMSEMTSACDVEFGCRDTGKNGSGIKENGFFRMSQYLVGLQYQTDYQSRSQLDESKLFAQLKLGAPHIMGGFDKRGENGHAWLIDGLRKNAKSFMYHCVWGWNGAGDGWIKGDYYTSSVGGISFSEGQSHIYITRMPLGNIRP